MTPAEKPLSPKQIRFAAEFVIDCNSTQAAIRAGYAAGSADVTGCRLLANARIKAMIAEKTKKVEAKLEFTAADVLNKFWKLADLDLTLVMNEDGSIKKVSEWPVGYGKLIGGLKIDELFEGTGRDRKQVGETKELKMETRNPNLVALARHLKLLTDKVEVSVDEDLAEILRKSRERSKSK